MAAAPAPNFNAVNKPAPTPAALAEEILNEIEKQDHGFSEPSPARLRQLVAQGADLSMRFGQRGTPFEAIRAEPGMLDQLGDMPQIRGQLLLAAADAVPQNAAEVKKILAAGNIDWTQADERGRGALHLATRREFADNVAAIAEKDPHILRQDKAGWNALMHAAHVADISLVEFFLEKKFPVLHRSPNGYTAIDLALAGENQGKWLSAARADIAVLLAAHGADILQKNEKGISPVDFLVINELGRTAEELKEAARKYSLSLRNSAFLLAEDVDAPEKASFPKLGKPRF